MRRPSSAWRRLALVVAWTAPVLGCTSLLGIDGEYTYQRKLATSDGGASGDGAVVNESGGGGSGGAGSGGTPGSGGQDAGQTPGTGGTQNTGGTGNEHDGAVTSGGGGSGGGAIADAGSPDCRVGTYSGTFTGLHAPAITVVGVPFNMKGPLSFDLQGTGPKLDVVNGTFTSTLAWGTFAGTVTGTYDCETHIVTAVFSGRITALPAFADFEGTLTGDLRANGDAKSRTWTEHETGITAVATPGVVPLPLGTGLGTWTITDRP
jgi:hypothetical protein